MTRFQLPSMGDPEEETRRETRREKLSGSSWSDESDASAHIDTRKAEAAIKSTPRRRSRRRDVLGRRGGFATLLDAATGAEEAAADRARRRKPWRRPAVDVENSRGVTKDVSGDITDKTAVPEAAFRSSGRSTIDGEGRGDEASRDGNRATSTSETRRRRRGAPRAPGGRVRHASAPPSAADALMTAARDRHLDASCRLSPRGAWPACAFGPHASRRAQMAFLVVALRGGGARAAEGGHRAAVGVGARAGVSGRVRGNRRDARRAARSSSPPSTSGEQSRTSELDEAAARGRRSPRARQARAIAARGRRRRRRGVAAARRLQKTLRRRRVRRRSRR